MERRRFLDERSPAESDCLQGGFSTGRTMTDECDVTPKIDNPVGTTPEQRFCHQQSPFLTQVKLLGAYTLPYDVQVSGTYQNIPGPAITASGTFVNAQIAPSPDGTSPGPRPPTSLWSNR